MEGKELLQGEESFDYTVTLEATLEIEEKLLVYDHMKAHPDIRRETRQGGFGFSFVNFYIDEKVNKLWKFREIDKMLKALEWPVKCDKGLKVRTIIKLRRWATAINEETQRVNL